MLVGYASLHGAEDASSLSLPLAISYTVSGRHILTICNAESTKPLAIVNLSQKSPGETRGVSLIKYMQIAHESSECFYFIHGVRNGSFVILRTNKEFKPFTRTRLTDGFMEIKRYKIQADGNGICFPAYYTFEKTDYSPTPREQKSLPVSSQDYLPYPPHLQHPYGWDQQVSPFFNPLPFPYPPVQQQFYPAPPPGLYPAPPPGLYPPVPAPPQPPIFFQPLRLPQLPPYQPLEPLQVVTPQETVPPSNAAPAVEPLTEEPSVHDNRTEGLQGIVAAMQEKSRRQGLHSAQPVEPLEPPTHPETATTTAAPAVVTEARQPFPDHIVDTAHEKPSSRKEPVIRYVEHTQPSKKEQKAQRAQREREAAALEQEKQQLQKERRAQQAQRDREAAALKKALLEAETSAAKTARKEAKKMVASAAKVQEKDQKSPSHMHGNTDDDAFLDEEIKRVKAENEARAQVQRPTIKPTPPPVQEQPRVASSVPEVKPEPAPITPFKVSFYNESTRIFRPADDEEYRNVIGCIAPLSHATHTATQEPVSLHSAEAAATPAYCGQTAILRYDTQTKTVRGLTEEERVITERFIRNRVGPNPTLSEIQTALANISKREK